MHINHQYLLELASDLRRNDSSARILDYGCGKGEMVEQGRAMGFDLYGTDIFYDANPETRDTLRAKGLLGSWIREIKDSRIPFEDGFFNLVVSNQVFEHVQDLGPVIEEINRVLKPGGYLVAMFPTLETWREGHSGIPFVHWFRKGSKLRYGYTITLRSLGMGFFKPTPSREWVQEMLKYLDNYTHYRSRKAITDIVARHFAVGWMESHCAAFRLRHTRACHLAFWLSFPPARWLALHAFRRLAFAVLVAQKGSPLAFSENSAFAAFVVTW